MFLWCINTQIKRLFKVLLQRQLGGSSQVTKVFSKDHVLSLPIKWQTKMANAQSKEETISVFEGTLKDESEKNPKWMLKK